MNSIKLRLSELGSTWILDLDGTVVKHNGYKTDGYDTLLEGAADFLKKIPGKDFIIFLTSRKEEEREQTEKFLKECNIRYNGIIFGLPYGERILINDKKPSGLLTAYACNIERDAFPYAEIETDPDI